MTPTNKQDTKPNPYHIQTIAAIIPAFNEEQSLNRILDVLIQVLELSEIIVVNDGSADKTLEIASQVAKREARLRIINHERNTGKGNAIFSGVQTTNATYIVTLDADLIGLTPEHIQALITPVIEAQADMTLGLFYKGYWTTDLSHRLTPWLSGQRCFRREMLDYVNFEAAAGYGLETALTVAARQQGWRSEPVPWRGVSHPPSEFHRGRWQGIKTRARMYYQILRALYLASRYYKAIRNWRTYLSFIA